MLNIDIVISKYENKKVAIEFNGPSHYVQCNGQDFENGTTKFKQNKFQHTQSLLAQFALINSNSK